MSSQVAAFLPTSVVDPILEAPRGFAAFDADGTLWREDVGEAFLRHLVALGWVSLPDGSDPYAAYERAVERDKAAGYAYAAQLMAGLAAAEVELEAQRFALQWVPPRLIQHAQLLLSVCRMAEHTAVVVSASALPIVQAAAAHAGIPAERCAGMTVRLTPGGRYTNQLVEPLTYARGKVDTLARRGWAPLALAAGDSLTGDLAMLETASVPIVVAPEGRGPLADEARSRGWAMIDQLR